MGYVGVEQIPGQAQGSVLREDWWELMLSRLPTIENNLLSIGHFWSYFHQELALQVGQELLICFA